MKRVKSFSILFSLRLSREVLGGEEDVFSHLSAGCTFAAKQWQICGIEIAVTHRFVSKSKWNLK